MTIKRPKGGWSLLRRLVLSSFLWMGLAFTVGALLLSDVFEDYARRKFDEHLVNSLESLIGFSDILNGGRVQLTRSLGDQRFDQVYSGWYWQINSPGSDTMRSRSLWDQLIKVDLDTPVKEMRFQQHVGPDFNYLRVVELDVIFPDRDTPVRYVVAGNEEELLADIQAFDTLLMYAMGMLAAMMLVTVAVQLWVSFRPLKNIRKELSAIRTGQAQYLEYEYPREVQPLASEVNALLLHNQNMVSRARRQVGNLAHALKTPLSVLRNDAAVKGDETALQRLDDMQKQVDHYLARARVMGRPRLAGARTHVKERLQALVRTVERLHGERVSFSIEGPDNLFFAGEQEDFDEIFGNLIDNAAKWAESQVVVYVREAGDYLCIGVDDDGPGVADEDLDVMFDHGVRLDESVPGTGLGLSIVRDILDIVDGEVFAEDSHLGGLSVDVMLPSVK